MDTFRHVLTPIDFSTASDAALTLGARIARACHARLTLLHVYPYSAPPDAEAPYFPDAADPLDDEMRGRIASELGRLARALPEPPPFVESVVREGQASSEILAYAEGREVDLIVLGAHGRRGLDRLIIGSVARHMCRHAPCPVLVTPNIDEATIPPHADHVLCALDLSEASHRTLHTAAALAKALGAKLTVFHAVQTWHWDDPLPIARGDDQPVREALAESARAQLARLVARHVDPDLEAEIVVTFGRPREEIVGLATACRASLVVLGAHPSTVLGRVLFGSTAEHVLRAMPCPVLLARPVEAAAGMERETLEATTW
jgi:nucleotide-binding universal stress UspA family protein